MKDEYQKIIDSVMNRERRVDLLIPNKVNATKFKRLLKHFDFDTCSERADSLLKTSSTIKHGHLLEVIAKIVLEKYGAKILYSVRTIRKEDGKEEKEELDVLFEYNNKKYLIELKANDDHDSTKKTTIVPSFRKKMIDNGVVMGAIWFVNDILQKNKSDYEKEIKNGEFLCYGEEIVSFLMLIMGEQIKNFYTEFDKIYLKYREQYRELGKIFNKDLDLKKINLERLADVIKTYSKKEAFDTFFNSEDVSNEILKLIPKNTTSKKRIYLREVLLNE